MTQRIPKVAKADAFFPAYAYMVVKEDGMYVTNGQVAIKYGPEKIGKVFADIAAECDGFALLDPERFMRLVSTFNKDESTVNLDKDKAVLELLGGRSTKDKKYLTRIELPILYPLVEDDLPQLQVRFKGWMPEEDKPSDANPCIPIDSRWQNFKELVTKEGEIIWKGSIGVYCRNGFLFSFDKDLLVVCPDKYPFMDDFFLPREFVELGFFGLSRLELGDDGIVHLIGPGIECVVKAEPVMNIWESLLEIETNFKNGRKYAVDINTTSQAWLREKAINDIHIWLSFKGGKVYLSRQTRAYWNEEIGESNAPEASYRARTSLIMRWAQKTTGHSVVMDEEGVCYLHGITRAGMDMYVVVTPEILFEDFPDEQAEDDGTEVAPLI